MISQAGSQGAKGHEIERARAEEQQELFFHRMDNIFRSMPSVVFERKQEPHPFPPLFSRKGIDTRGTSSHQLFYGALRLDEFILGLLISNGASSLPPLLASCFILPALFSFPHSLDNSLRFNASS